MGLHDRTTAAHGERGTPSPAVRRFRLNIVEGPKAGTLWSSEADRCSIGSQASNDLVLEDQTVSRFHCEIRIGPAGARVRDLDSRNGTVLDGIQVFDAVLRDGSLLRLGRAAIRFEVTAETNQLPLSDRQEFGSMVGASVPMRAAFALMERAAEHDVTVLLEGETGTGKGEAAEAMHLASSRRDKSLVVVDCAAIAANLLESELFGHEKGAFTGADTRRVGAFEEASGGTIFLDEIGELPLDLQPKLLRVLENREVRRLGSNAYRPIDVRVIAATNRDLRAEVNAGRFRPDLYFRMAVMKIALPSLRERLDDIPLLVDAVLSSMRGAKPEDAARLRAPEFVAGLQRGAWPGNVRELRNHIERCLVMRDGAPRPEGDEPAERPTAIDLGIPFADARRRTLDDFERSYLRALLHEHGGNVPAAAGAAGVTRVHLYRLLRRHGIKP